jgi:FlaG/FlaF family flagellin (archaellin)
MNSLIKAVAIAAVLAAPIASFAQSSQQPVTRADVRNELIQLEHAGYNPGATNDTTYPADIQAAEHRVQAENPAVAQTQPVADTSGYGAPMSGSSQAGGVLQPAAGPKSVYFGN